MIGWNTPQSDESSDETFPRRFHLEHTPMIVMILATASGLKFSGLTEKKNVVES